nr:SID1 transmembrane family member 1-like [Pocillopora verrucosa]
MAMEQTCSFLLCIICISEYFLPICGTLVLHESSNILEYRNASMGHTVNGVVSQHREQVWLYSWINKTEPYAVRVTVESQSANQDYPLLFVARLQRGVVSWPIPVEGFNYNLVSRTLCPFSHGITQLNRSEAISIDVSTSSQKPVNYSLKAMFADKFQLSMNTPLTVTVDPAQPVYFLWRYPKEVDTVVIKAESKDYKLCAILSVQGTTCPVYDLARNVEFTGHFQTMTTKAAITLEHNQTQFYVVLIVKSSDEECVSGERFAEPRTGEPVSKDPHSAGPSSQRQKTVTITVESTLSEKDYVKAIVAPVLFFGSFYIIAFSFLLFTWCRQKRGRKSFRSILMPKESNNKDAPISAPLRTSSSRRSRRSRDHYGSTPQGIFPINEPLDTDSLEHSENDHLVTDGVMDPSSKDFEKHYDMLHDIEVEKDVYRLRTSLMLTDLAKKEKKYLKKKYRHYHWNLLLIAVFYALPVVQLVITYQKVLNFSGDEDICYYNFFCAHPLGVLSAFNNVFSNIGYIMLGFLFLLLVLRRDRQHKLDVAENSELEKNYGIPQHYAIFYAMGLALIMEGVLSGCYHVCPNNSNFQFDTSFMYIITCLGVVKLYQTRHPDIAANAHIVYTGFAAIIFIAMIGVVYSSFAFWTTFAIIHIFGCLYLSSQIYYMGRVKFDAGMFARVFVLLRYDCCSCPVYKDRMLLLVIANAVNWVFAIYGVVATPNDFATYLLAILIVNGLLYLAFYVIMKLRNKERLLLFPSVTLCLTLFCWILALVFFLSNLTSWQKSPARSREGNKECVLLGFYDAHDVWHFLSACALFLSFLGLLTLDDDLLETPRHRIPVF